MKAIMYHYVREFNSELPNFKYLEFKKFREQLDFFEKNYGFVTRENWDNYISNGNFKNIKGKILLTFDDMMSCHFSNVSKELERRKLWGIFFVPTFPYTNDNILDVHKIHLLTGIYNHNELLRYTNTLVKDEYILNDKKELFDKSTYQYQKNPDDLLQLKKLLNYYLIPASRSEVINELCKKFPINKFTKHFYVKENDIIIMSKKGNIIGSHSHNHLVMSNLSMSNQKKDIEKSFSYLGSLLGIPINAYCHPYGGFHSFNDDTISILKGLKVEYAFNTEKSEFKETDRVEKKYYLPRFDCNQFLV